MARDGCVEATVYAADSTRTARPHLLRALSQKDQITFYAASAGKLKDIFFHREITKKCSLMPAKSAWQRGKTTPGISYGGRNYNEFIHFVGSKKPILDREGNVLGPHRRSINRWDARLRPDQLRFTYARSIQPQGVVVGRKG
jgi:hypothetical protein